MTEQANATDLQLQHFPQQPELDMEALFLFIKRDSNLMRPAPGPRPSPDKETEAWGWAGPHGRWQHQDSDPRSWT